MSLQEKKTLLAKKLSEKKKKGNEVTDSQKSLWYIYKSSPTSNAYNQYFASVLKGNLNKRAFLSAFEKTIIKHAELRARFEEKDGVLYKYIDDDIDGFVTEINCEDYSEEAVKTKVNELVKIPFVLEGGKL
jgi:Condensation domain.